MGWVILKHIFSTNTAILNIRRLSTLEKVLETLELRQQLTILKLKRKTCRFDRLIPPSHNPNALAFRRTHKIKSQLFQLYDWIRSGFSPQNNDIFSPNFCRFLPTMMGNDNIVSFHFDIKNGFQIRLA